MKESSMTTLITQEYKGDYGEPPKSEWVSVTDNRGVIFQVLVSPEKVVSVQICNDKEWLKKISAKEFHSFLIDILEETIKQLK